MTNTAALSPPKSSESAPPPEGWMSIMAGDPLPVCVLILLWGYVIYRLGSLWHIWEDYAYGWCVPLLCLCLFCERWKRRPARSPVRPAGGTFLLLALFGLTILPADLFLEVIPYWRFAGWIFAATALGLTFILLYFIGGRNWSRFFAFPVIFFLIAVPWPSRIEQPLIEKMSYLNATVSAASANILGSPAVRHGVVIETGAGEVGVDDACSGIRSLQGSIMVALFLGELLGYSFLRRFVLLLGAVTLAFACNVVRTTYLVCIADLHGIAMVKARHDQAGFAILGITLLGLLALVWLLRRRPHKHSANFSDEEPWHGNEEGGQAGAFPGPEEEDASPAPPGIASHRESEEIPEPARISRLSNPRFIKAALAGLVVWIAVVELGIHFWFSEAEKQAAVPASWSLKFPAQAAEFRESSPGERVQSILGYDDGRKAEWRDDNGSVWQLYYLRWLPAENKYRAVAASMAYGHGIDLCMQVAGKVLQTNYGMHAVSINGVRLELVAERFLDQERNFNVFSCYWEPTGLLPQLEAPSTLSLFHAVVDSLRVRNRGRNEKRVIEAGVWGKGSDEEAQAMFKQYLAAMISKTPEEK